jgi:adhesin/invasin
MLLAACNKDEAPRTPSVLSATSATNVAGTVGELIGDPLVVKVTDDRGGPLGGVVVTFNVADGGGSVTPAVDTTDNLGEASTRWRLGGTAGQQRVSAAVVGVATQVNFTAAAVAAAPATVAVQAGSNQNAVAGAAVAVPPAVVVRDRFNNPVNATSVFFSVASGGGSVTGAGATTNATGIATVGSWILGPAAGTNTLTALVVANGVTSNPITFSAIGTAGAAASLTAQTPITTSANVGALVALVPSVRVLDANGNPVAGVTVAFSASTGSNVVGATKTTSAAGIASPDGWQLGAAVGTYTLTASVGSLTPVVFTATARAGTPATMSIVAGNNQSAVVGRTLPIDPAVRIADALGNPISGLEVVYEVISGGGSALVRRPVTDANGVASLGAWTLGDTPGTNTLRATATGLTITGNPATFTATATAGAPASVAVSAGNNQTATVATVLPINPSVVVRDNRGNPVPGATVTFLIGSGGGTVVGATVTTDAAGLATVGSWALGTGAGTQTLIARVANLADVIFTATATAGSASVLTAQSNVNLGAITVASSQNAPSLPSVRVTDAQGNPVAGITVTFELGNNASGSITGATQTTNANGIATLGSWLLPTFAGTASVVASIPNAAGVTFIATMTPAAASRIINAGTPTTWSLVGNGSTVSATLRITDQFGNAVSLADVAITFAVSGGSSITQAVNTNASGVATLTFAAGVATTTYTINATGPSGYSALSPFTITIAP